MCDRIYDSRFTSTPRPLPCARARRGDDALPSQRERLRARALDPGRLAAGPHASGRRRGLSGVDAQVTEAWRAERRRTWALRPH
eukprot:6197357-Pleurochrysis_carterae.AAC.1